MIYFTMRFGNGANKLYYVYVNDDFDTIESMPRLLYEYPQDGISAIDGDIVRVMVSIICSTWHTTGRPASNRLFPIEPTVVMNTSRRGVITSPRRAKLLMCGSVSVKTNGC